MRSVLTYTAARLLLFLATVGVLYLLELRGLVLLAAAILLSGLISFVLLSGQRDAMSSKINSLVEGKREKFEAMRSREDSL